MVARIGPRRTFKHYLREWRAARAPAHVCETAAELVKTLLKATGQTEVGAPPTFLPFPIDCELAACQPTPINRAMGIAMQPSEPKTKFTPGPWMFAEGNHRVFTPDGSDDVAFATASFERGRTYGEMVANARLIAAAPNLYAAGEALIRLHDTYTGEPRDDDAISLAMDDLRAAIARANGEG